MNAAPLAAANSRLRKSRGRASGPASDSIIPIPAAHNSRSRPPITTGRSSRLGRRARPRVRGRSGRARRCRPEHVISAHCRVSPAWRRISAPTRPRRGERPLNQTPSATRSRPALPSTGPSTSPTRRPSCWPPSRGRAFFGNASVTSAAALAKRKTSRCPAGPPEDVTVALVRNLPGATRAQIGTHHVRACARRDRSADRPQTSNRGDEVGEDHPHQRQQARAGARGRQRDDQVPEFVAASSIPRSRRKRPPLLCCGRPTRRGRREPVISVWPCVLREGFGRQMVSP
jgi:hypothetical protein